MVLDEDYMKQISILRKKRGVIKASLTRLRNFVKDFDPNVQSISLIEFRQEELPHINRKFDAVQCEIDMLTEELEREEEERDTFERDYFEARSHMQEIINIQKASSTIGHNASFGTTPMSNRVKLAPIQLPKFNGNIREWEPFYDCFKVMVHQEDYYSPSQKFHYLRSTLSGQALDLIKSLPMNDANYIVALTKLQQRYDNRSLVIQSHIRELLNSPRIRSASAQELFNLHSHVSAHVAALHALNQPISHWDAWLVTIIVERMDHATAHEWQLRRPDTNLPSYAEVMEFLSNRCIAFESSETLSNRVSMDKDCQQNKSLNTKKATDKGHLKGTLFAANDSFDQKCACCSSTHKLFSCTKFKDLPVSDRLNLVRDAKLCFNCLYPYHTVNKCRSRYSCQTCKGRHNSLLHLDNSNDVTVNTKSNEHGDDPTSSSNQNSKAALLVHQGIGHVFLATARVLLKDNCGVYRSCRAVLDNGSQLNFISKKLVRQLQLSPVESALPISGIGASTVQSSASVNVQVKSMFGNYSFTVSCQILPIIVSQLAPIETPSGGWNIPNVLITKLADPNFFEPRQIDLLIGGGIFFELLQPNRRQLDVNTLHLQDSKLGWIVTGEIGATSLLSAHTSLNDNWDNKQMDESFSYGKSSKANQHVLEENQALQHFQNTVTRNHEGRFVLRLPVKSQISNLGHSYNMATSRFLNVERRLQKDTKLRTEYINFMKEYLEMGHMRLAPVESNIPERSFYLPHHAVFKTSSLTTKIRVVFDASAKTTTGISLNDVLMRGPTTQDDIFSILIRFRRHQYVITADIEKMFRQISVHEQDWNLQRILWRGDPSEVLRTYQLVTVTYGTTPASFMSTQCLISLAQQVEGQFARAAETIRRDFYMDDLMTGAETQEECIQLQKEIISILESAKLPLRKWCSNSSQILNQIGRNTRDSLFTLEIGDDETIKSLGLTWSPLADQFRFTISMISRHDNLTKRMILSDLNKIFDPLGFLSPVLIKGKIFLQQMWARKTGWDTQL